MNIDTVRSAYKHSILAILSRRVGNENAITGAALAEQLGINPRDDRTVQLVILSLIEDGYPIASSVQTPMGYFLIKSKEEAEIYETVLKSRMVNTAIRRRDFRKAARHWLENSQQLTLV
jgi:hypothetical protein